MNFLTKNIRIIAIVVFALVLLSFFLFKGEKKTEQSFFVFDTVAQTTLYGKNSDAALTEIASVLFDLEKSFSKYQTGSALSRFNSLTVGENLTVSEEMAQLINRSVNISKNTGGAFDITTSALSDVWQIKTATAPPPDQEILSALNKTGYEKISLVNTVLTKTDADLDFGGILKGFAADKIRYVAQTHGVERGIVNLGGNVCLIGSNSDGKPWTVGIVNPFSPSEIYLTIQAENTNVITSGAYQRYFEHNGKTYHHILSPETGYPAETDVASVTVISQDGTLADALSTAIFVQGSEKGLETARQFDVKAIIIKKDGSVIATDGIEYAIQN